MSFSALGRPTHKIITCHLQAKYSLWLKGLNWLFKFSYYILKWFYFSIVYKNTLVNLIFSEILKFVNLLCYTRQRLIKSIILFNIFFLLCCFFATKFPFLNSLSIYFQNPHPSFFQNPCFLLFSFLYQWFIQTCCTGPNE